MSTKTKTFFEIAKKALEGAIEDFKLDRPLTRRDVDVPESPPGLSPKDLARLRTDVFRVSQHVFAGMVNVAPKTVQGWEQGRNVPTGATLRLLHLARRHPEILRSECGMSNVKPNRPRKAKVGSHG
jgi:putative transcriptional regulator